MDVFHSNSVVCTTACAKSLVGRMRLVSIGDINYIWVFRFGVPSNEGFLEATVAGANILEGGRSLVCV